MNACHFRESFLLLIECHDGVGSDFDCDGDMEEIHPPDGNGKTMLSAEFARGANGILPIELGMRPVAEANFLFEETDQFAGFPCNNDSRPLKLAQRIEDLDALPWRPDDLNIWKYIEYLNGSAVVGIIGDLASDPPRCVPIDHHFFNVRRNATPSNLPLPPPTARASASSRVMRGRVLPTTLRFGLCVAVFIGVQT